MGDEGCVSKFRAGRLCGVQGAGGAAVIGTPRRASGRKPHPRAVFALPNPLSCPQAKIWSSILAPRDSRLDGPWRDPAQVGLELRAHTHGARCGLELTSGSSAEHSGRDDCKGWCVLLVEWMCALVAAAISRCFLLLDVFLRGSSPSPSPSSLLLCPSPRRVAAPRAVPSVRPPARPPASSRAGLDWIGNPDACGQR